MITPTNKTTINTQKRPIESRMNFKEMVNEKNLHYDTKLIKENRLREAKNLLENFLFSAQGFHETLNFFFLLLVMYCKQRYLILLLHQFFLFFAIFSLSLFFFNKQTQRTF
jgi:hypothetical protein